MNILSPLLTAPTHLHRAIHSTRIQSRRGRGYSSRAHRCNPARNGSRAHKGQSGQEWHGASGVARWVGVVWPRPPKVNVAIQFSVDLSALARSSTGLNGDGKRPIESGKKTAVYLLSQADTKVRWCQRHKGVGMSMTRTIVTRLSQQKFAPSLGELTEIMTSLDTHGTLRCVRGYPN
jgi:hypothetical protein